MFLMMESVRPLMTSSHLWALSALESNRCAAGKAKSGLTAQQDGWGKGEHFFQILVWYSAFYCAGVS